VAFYVSGDSQQIQDVTVSRVNLSCSNGSSTYDDNFTIPSAAINSETTFSGSSSQSTATETITYTFNGHFHGLNTSGNQRAAGQVSEVIAYTSGGGFTCTSNNLSWTAALGGQGSQKVAPPLPGGYTGGDSQGGSVAFTVSGNSQQIQDMTVSRVNLSCSNGSSTYDDNFTIPSAAINSETTFSGSSSQSTATETTTYTFSGHFHGLNTSGYERAAGQLSEVIDYTSAGYTCTSNNLSWSATS
jgi:hypothetical protein